MIYLIIALSLQTIAIGFLYYKAYSKPKSPVVRMTALPPGFVAKATPIPKKERVLMPDNTVVNKQLLPANFFVKANPMKKPETPAPIVPIEFKRSSYDIPKK